MDDELELGEFEAGEPARMNWADVAYAALWPARGFVEGCSNAFRVLHTVLGMHSASIVEKQQFVQSAGRDIEAISDVREA